MQPYDIHKSAGIIIQDRKILVTRTKGKDFFVAPGGKLEAGEAPEQALVRELAEELGISLDLADLGFFETFYAQAKGQEENMLRMDCYFITRREGKIVPESEIEEIVWVNTSDVADYAIGSVFAKEVIPKLKNQNLID